MMATAFQPGAFDLSILVITVALAVGALLAFQPRLRASSAWRATITPLSSIMGSGFLVCAPLLVALVGAAAPLAMAALLLVAFGVGSVIRFNIRWAEPLVGRGETRHEHRHFHGHQQASAMVWNVTEQHAAVRLEQLSHVVLAGAYIVSVTYYLQLFGAFVLATAGVDSPEGARLITTALLSSIAVVGWWRGLKALEKFEQYAIALNLGTIFALLVGLAVHDGSLLSHGRHIFPAVQAESDPFRVARSLMGLLVVVQGFETSRFLGAQHSSAERISTMRWAQIIASIIYLVFTTLVLALFSPGAPPQADVTAIVLLVAPVAAVLPLLVSIAAAGSQISASVADDAGCAGLLATALAGRLPTRWSYLLIGLGAITLTWGADIIQVISVASRAFALFYALQCAVAVATAVDDPGIPRRKLVMVFAGAMGLVCLLTALFGLPAE